MIQLTRLNGNPLYVNIDMIKWAEAAPDTMLSLTNGEKVVVRESCDELVQRLKSYRVHLLMRASQFGAEAGAPAGGTVSPAHAPRIGSDTDSG
jgi:flagellar protein FlbD